MLTTKKKRTTVKHRKLVTANSCSSATIPDKLDNSMLMLAAMHVSDIAMMLPVLLMLRPLRCTVMGCMSASDVKVNQRLLHSNTTVWRPAERQC